MDAWANIGSIGRKFRVDRKEESQGEAARPKNPIL
jgi:hypothetical protein